MITIEQGVDILRVRIAKADGTRCKRLESALAEIEQAEKTLQLGIDDLLTKAAAKLAKDKDAWGALDRILAARIKKITEDQIPNKDQLLAVLTSVRAQITAKNIAEELETYQKMLSLQIEYGKWVSHILAEVGI